MNDFVMYDLSSFIYSGSPYFLLTSVLLSCYRSLLFIMKHFVQYGVIWQLSMNQEKKSRKPDPPGEHTAQQSTAKHRTA